MPDTNPFVALAGAIGVFTTAMILMLVLFAREYAWVSIFIVLFMALLGVILGQFIGKYGARKKKR